MKHLAFVLFFGGLFGFIYLVQSGILSFITPGVATVLLLLALAFGVFGPFLFRGKPKKQSAQDIIHGRIESQRTNQGDLERARQLAGQNNWSAQEYYDRQIRAGVSKSDAAAIMRQQYPNQHYRS